MKTKTCFTAKLPESNKVSQKSLFPTEIDTFSFENVNPGPSQNDRLKENWKIFKLMPNGY